MAGDKNYDVDLWDDYRRIVREHRLSSDHPVSALVASFIELLGRDRASLPKLRESLTAEMRRSQDVMERKQDTVLHKLVEIERGIERPHGNRRRAMAMMLGVLALATFVTSTTTALIGYQLLTAKSMCIVTDIQSTTDGRRGGLCAWK
ncbi:MAG: hypothetical protein LCH61_10480 [Proteobacteria bacterium]|nr:hypothetical protein [Pseudomonadota bacterium]